MHRPAPRVTIWLRHVAAWWAATTAVLLLAAMLVTANPPRAAAQAPPPVAYDILAPTAEEMARVRPGDRVQVRIQAAPRTEISSISYCSLGIPAKGYDVALGYDPFQATCKSVVARTPAYERFYATPEGLLEFTITIPPEGQDVVAPAPLTAPAGTPPLLRCGVGDACRLILSLVRFDPATGTNAISDLFADPELVFTPQPLEAFKGCGFPQAGALDALGPTRLSEAAIAWTRDRCVGTAAPVDFQYTGLSDGAARDLVREGDGDVYFSAGGVTTDVFPPESATVLPERTTVAVPVALNASVVAFNGSSGRPYPDDPNIFTPQVMGAVTLTRAELAVILTRSTALLVNGADNLRRSYADPTVPDLGAGYLDPARNPELARLPAVQHNSQVAGLASPEASTWALTRYIEAGASQYWRFEDKPGFYGADAGQPVGTRTTLQALTYAGGTTLLFANRNGVLSFVNQRARECGPVREGCVNYVLTDAATAAELRLPVAQLENASGAFVAPTRESLDAAALSMETAADGTLVAPAAERNAAAYPLPMVEYVNFPSDLCGPQQATAKDLARYLITEGQDPVLLGEGLQPLPEALRDDAEAAVTRIEAAPDTPCEQPAPAAEQPAAPTQQAPPPGPAPASGGTAPASGGAAGGGRAPSAGAGTAPAPAASPPGPPLAPAGPAPAQAVDESPRVPAVQDRAAARAAAAEVEIPALSGAARMGMAPPLAALALLAALPAGTASASANWSPRRPAGRRRLRLPLPRRR